MGEKPKKRAWFQIHLSTAIVVMLFVASMLFINLGIVRIRSGLKLEKNTVTPFYSYRFGIARSGKILLETEKQDWAAEFLAHEASRGKTWDVRFLYSLEDVPQEDRAKIHAFLPYFDRDYIEKEYLSKKSMIENFLACRWDATGLINMLSGTLGGVVGLTVACELMVRRCSRKRQQTATLDPPQ